jgi:thymidylate kinase
MIIILEGPDGAGKSTLVKQLAQHFGDEMVHTIHHGPYPNMPPEALCKTFFRSMTPALTFNDTVIMDRSWLSEPIYGAIYRNGDIRVDLPRRRMLERVALSRGGVVIHCQPSFEACANAFMARKDEEYLDDLTQLRQVYDEYETLGLRTELPIVHYDYETDSFDEVLTGIRSKSIQNGAGGGGCFKEGVILMLCDKGPRANIRPSAAVVPFINFLDDDGPSRMLAMTFEKEGISENDIYWINTQSHDGRPTNPEFIRRLRPRQIFALGNNAYTWAYQNGVRAIKLPPPLYHMQNYPNQPYHILEADYGIGNDL